MSVTTAIVAIAIAVGATGTIATLGAIQFANATHKQIMVRVELVVAIIVVAMELSDVRTMAEEFVQTPKGRCIEQNTSLSSQEVVLEGLTQTIAAASNN